MSSFYTRGREESVDSVSFSFSLILCCFFLCEVEGNIHNLLITIPVIRFPLSHLGFYTVSQAELSNKTKQTHFLIYFQDNFYYIPLKV